MRRLLSIVVSVCALVLFPAIAPCVASTPFFFDTSPETTIVDLNAGQTSFLITGSAYDPDASHTVDFFTFGLQPFMTFETTPGNSASFRIHAENLTGLQYGGYSIDVVAIDNASPRPFANSYTFIVGIVPEPASLVVVLLLPLSRRSGRGFHALCCGPRYGVHP